MDLKTNIQRIPYIGRIKRIARAYGLEVFIVGGFLRDLLLKGGIARFDTPALPQKAPLSINPERTPSTALTVYRRFDFDFALKRKVFKLARDFSRTCGGRVVVLDKVLRNVRVAVRGNREILNYDFSRFRDRTLRSDIEKRDFTINALAVRVNDLPKAELIDYIGGVKDIKRKLLRCVGDSSFRDDPLRIMRAFSLSAVLGLRIDENTQRLIKKNAHLLRKTAAERISDELFKIFSVKDSHKTLSLMDKLGVLESVFPEIRPMRKLGQGRYHHLDVWDHSLESLRCFETLVARKLKAHRPIISYLSEQVAQNRTRGQLIKFACIFHDVGKPKACKKKKKKTFFHGHEKIGRDMTEEVAKRLRFSLREKEFVKHLIYFHLRPGYLADIKRPSPRAVYRYFRDTAEEAVGILLLSLSDWRATRGPLTDLKRRKKHEKIMLFLADEYFKKRTQPPLKRLVTGYDVMEKIKVPPSPIVGLILRKVTEMQALGKISTKRQALMLASQIYRKYRQ